MRDSDLAIGGLVLFGIVAALVYLLFPNFIAGILRGPSYADVLRGHEREIAVFNRDTEVVISYLTNSWTMKVYRKVNSLTGRNFYAPWVRQVKSERNILVRRVDQEIENQRQTADGLAQLLESKEAVRHKTAESIFKLSKSPLDSEIEILQAELDKKRNELSQIVSRFSAGRRKSNEIALRGWFHRSLLVGFIASAAVTSFFGAIFFGRILVNGKARNKSVTPGIHLHRSFLPASDQPGLIEAVEGFVLTDSSFHFTFEPRTGPIPEPIEAALETLPKTTTALKLASILGAYPDIPASGSHHLSSPGGLIVHTAKVLRNSEPLLPLLSNPGMGPVVVLAHDIGKVFTLNIPGEGRPHDIPSADILASIRELRENFDEIIARSMIFAVRHQHSITELPLNAPPMTKAILQFIKKADLAASAEESREAAERIKERLSEVVEFFSYILSELNVNGCRGGKAEGYLSDGYLFVLKRTVKDKFLSRLGTQDAPVFKGQDPVWNEMALALSNAGLIIREACAKEAGRKSCLFTIKTPHGQEKAIAIPLSIVAHRLIQRWLQGDIQKIEVL